MMSIADAAHTVSQIAHAIGPNLRATIASAVVGAWPAGLTHHLLPGLDADHLHRGLDAVGGMGLGDEARLVEHRVDGDGVGAEHVTIAQEPLDAGALEVARLDLARAGSGGGARVGGNRGLAGDLAADRGRAAWRKGFDPRGR